MYYQACYTRVGGQGAESGWQTIFVTPYISDEALERFKALATSVIRRKNIQAEMSSEVYMVYSDEKYTYVCNIVMESSGDDGRGNSFAHAYICKKRDYFHLLKSDPEAVLVKDINFKKKKKELSERISECVDCLEHYHSTKEEIIDKYDLRKAYVNLFYCILTVMSQQERRLFIFYKCKDPNEIKRVCKDIMFLVISSLPSVVRADLSFSAGEKGKSKICFICQPPVEGQKYFDLNRKIFNCDISGVTKFSFTNQCLYDSRNQAWEKTMFFMESVFGKMRGETVSCRLMESVYCYYREMGKISSNAAGILNDMLAAKPEATPVCYTYLRALLECVKEEDVDIANRERLGFLAEKTEDERFKTFYNQWKKSDHVKGHLDRWKKRLSQWSHFSSLTRIEKVIRRKNNNERGT